MRPVLRLLDPEARHLYGTEKVTASSPPTFESLNISNWMVLYEFNVPNSERTKDTLILDAAPKDRAIIYTDDRFSGVLSRTHSVTRSILKSSTENVKILVENQGRVNFGNIDVADFKVRTKSLLIYTLTMRK